MGDLRVFDTNKMQDSIGSQELANMECEKQ
jgi:hypothetical protein